MQKNEMNEECAVQDERMHTLVIEEEMRFWKRFVPGSRSIKCLCWTVVRTDRSVRS